MKSVFVNSMNIFSPLGKTAQENYANLINGKSGVKNHNRVNIDDNRLWASLIDDDMIEVALPKNATNDLSRYEKIIMASIADALTKSNVDVSGKNTLFVFSTTKGNISLLENGKDHDSVNLMRSAELITEHFQNPNKPVVISNACISGVVALLYARRMLDEGTYENVIVTGADCINKFIYSGFSSFQALSNSTCKPFSDSRDGINLGEAASTIILTVHNNKKGETGIQVLNGAITNDANHISGPSRTGEELSEAIEKAIRLSGINKNEIGFISAHGTATSYNDEMEAKAIHLSGLEKTPVNSLKGYFGHTLGAAGLVESVIGIMALAADEIIPTSGYVSPCVEPAINVSNSIQKKPGMKYFLKTASGFGGCNAALIFSKQK